jgi:hypothetical protein
MGGDGTGFGGADDLRVSAFRNSTHKVASWPASRKPEFGKRLPISTCHLYVYHKPQTAKVRFTPEQDWMCLEARSGDL